MTAAVVSDKDVEFERDNDSLYVMPLRIMPLETTALKRARLVKDSRLTTAIELFKDLQSGSGLLNVEKCGERFGWPKDGEHPDHMLLKQLCQLPSFDVYSLRIRLRDMGMNVETLEHLRLSEAKRAELKEYMHVFTLPLIKRIYGDGEMDLQSVDDIFRLFQDPDTKNALAKLKHLASELGIQLHEIPKFLEDFSDIYMSLAYYQQYLDDLTPKVTRFIQELQDMKDNWQMRQDETLMKTCEELSTGINQVLASVGGRFESFGRNTVDMWQNISAERFEAVRKLIMSYHTTLGGVLCGLGLKMNTWVTHFPNPEAGGLMARADLLRSSIRPGLEEILLINRSAPTLSG